MARLCGLDDRPRPAHDAAERRARVHERVPAGRGDLSRRAVSLAHARRLALHAQALAAAPARGVAARGPEAVAALVARIGCLQLDPVSTVARSPLLVLFARLGPVREGALEAAAYERRALFDAWAHEASLVATADLPLHRWAMRTTLAGPSPRAARAREFLAANAAFCDELVAELRARGPLRARALEDRSAQPWRHGWWTDEVSSRQTIGRLLHLLWITGRIGVARRIGAERVWDVFERCLPGGAGDGDAGGAAQAALYDVAAQRRPGAAGDGDAGDAAQAALYDIATQRRPGGAGAGRAVRAELDDSAAEREAALRAVRMLGVARMGHVRAHFLRGRYRQLPETLAALVGADRLEQVTVAGLRGEWFAAPADLDRRAELPPGSRTTALSPFDNLLCDRARTAELFGFEHRLEIYVPPAKRRWGYYVLPILHRDRIVARADAALDRDAGVLRVKALYHEPDVRRTAALDRAITRALERLATWSGASGVVIERG